MSDYHHYKHELIDETTDRVAVYERHVADLMFASKPKDSDRETSLLFELKHQHGTIQFARLLARQRGLNEDVCALAALLHDIHAGLNGTYQDHAKKSANIANDLMDRLGLFTSEEKALVIKIIENHSDKHIWTDDPYQEIGKDADILDCFLYPTSTEHYVRNKAPEVAKQYFKRAQKVFDELKIPNNFGCIGE